MGPCDVYDNWETGDRFEMLKQLIADAIEEWGFDEVEVVNSNVDDAPAEYDSNTIYLDMSDEAFDEPQYGMNIAYHEAMHAMLDQAGFGGGGFEEELRVGFLGARAADEALEGCRCAEPVESAPGGGSVPPFPFRCDLDDGF